MGLGAEGLDWVRMAGKTPFPLIFALWGAGLGAAAQYGKVSVVFDLLPNAYPGAGAAMGFIVSLVGFVGIMFGVVAGLVVARCAGGEPAALRAPFPGHKVPLGPASESSGGGPLQNSMQNKFTELTGAVASGSLTPELPGAVLLGQNLVHRGKSTVSLRI